MMSSPFGMGLLVWLAVNLAHAAALLLAARAFGVAPNRITLGVGPTLWSRVRGPTTIVVALIPIAIRIRLRPRWSKETTDVWPPSEQTDLRGKPLLVRLLVFASAPSAILLLALAATFWMHGFARPVPSEEPVIGQVLTGFPADLAGLREGDRLMSVDGTPVSTWTEVLRATSRADDGVTRLELRRGDEVLQVEVHRQFGPFGEPNVMGIVRSHDVLRPLDPAARFGATFVTVGEHMRLFGRGLIFAIRGPSEGRPLGGPVLFLQPVLKRPEPPSLLLARFLSLAFTIYFVQCLVLPYLDGRRLLFLGIEAAARRPIHPRYEQGFNRVWLGCFVVLQVLMMATVFMNDLRR